MRDLALGDAHVSVIDDIEKRELGTDWVSYCSCDFGNKNKMGDVAQ
jgi:hypothetical protein